MQPPPLPQPIPTWSTPRAPRQRRNSACRLSLSSFRAFNSTCITGVTGRSNKRPREGNTIWLSGTTGERGKTASNQWTRSNVTYVSVRGLLHQPPHVASQCHHLRGVRVSRSP